MIIYAPYYEKFYYYERFERGIQNGVKKECLESNEKLPFITFSLPSSENLYYITVI